jgi:hypothetical protein
MSQIAFPQVEAKSTPTDWQRLCTLGGVTLLLQLALLSFSLIVGFSAGSEPATAAEAFAALQNDGVAGLLRLDWATAGMVALFPFVAVGLYAAFQRTRPAYGLLALLMIVIGSLLGIANNSAFSLMYLSDLHATANTAVQQQSYLAAGEALIAGNHWNSTATFLAGLFMQGGFVFISFIMLGDNSFSKWSAYTGIIANGLDLIHVLAALFAPTAATTLLIIGGVFYIPWFLLLGRDLIRQGRGHS